MAAVAKNKKGLKFKKSSSPHVGFIGFDKTCKTLHPTKCARNR
jgi:hypothetical protein